MKCPACGAELLAPDALAYLAARVAYTASWIAMSRVREGTSDPALVEPSRDLRRGAELLVEQLRCRSGECAEARVVH